MKIINNIKNKFKNWNPSNFATILLLLLPYFVFAIKEFVLDNDFWFLYNTGKVILEKGFIMIEPFTIHENLVFIPQQWLTDVIFYLIYNRFNIIGMLILVLIVNGLIIFLIYKLSFLLSNKKNISIITSIVIDMIYLIQGIITTRPQMFDIIIFLLELFLLENYIKYKKNIYLYFLPLISLLLINLHASMWLMFFVFLVPYYLEYYYKKIMKEDSYEIKNILIITIISLLIGFINPYTYHSVIYLFNSYGIKEINKMVGEMMPITIEGAAVVYFIFLFDLLMIYINKGNNKIRYILLFLGTFYLSLSHYKGVLYFFIISVVIISNSFYSVKKVKSVNLSILEKLIYNVLIIGLITFISLNINLVDESKMALKKVTDYLDETTNKNIKLFTGYNEGSYLEYHGYKCYIDPRAEVFLKKNNKKEDIFYEYYNLNKDFEKIQPFLKKYKFDYLLISKSHDYLLYVIKNDRDYKLVKEVDDKNEKEVYYLFERIKYE